MEGFSLVFSTSKTCEGGVFMSYCKVFHILTNYYNTSYPHTLKNQNITAKTIQTYTITLHSKYN